MLVTWKSRSSARFATYVMPWHIAPMMTYAVVIYNNAAVVAFDTGSQEKQCLHMSLSPLL